MIRAQPENLASHLILRSDCHCQLPLDFETIAFSASISLSAWISTALDDHFSRIGVESFYFIEGPSYRTWPALISKIVRVPPKSVNVLVGGVR